MNAGNSQIIGYFRIRYTNNQIINDIVSDPLTAIRFDRAWGLESAKWSGLKSALPTD